MYLRKQCKSSIIWRKSQSGAFMSLLTHLDIFLISFTTLILAYVIILHYACARVLTNLNKLTKVSWDDVVELQADVASLKVQLGRTNTRITGLGNSKGSSQDVNEILMSAIQPSSTPPTAKLGG